MNRNSNLKWPCHNLAVLISFLKERSAGKISVVSISEVTGLSTDSISHLFMRDNARLSTIEAIAISYGFDLELRFPVVEPIGDLSPSCRHVYPHAGNLKGLADYIQNRNMSLEAAAIRIGVGRGVLARAFASGDIMIDQLIKICDGLDITPLWNWKRREEC